MTVTVNLHNCAAWVTVTSYSVGDRRSNDTAPVKAYQCTTAGLSAAGPTGTGSSISDGTVVWKYLSAVDYTTMAAAISGLGTLSQPAVINMWNDAEWAMSNVSISGNSTTSTNTLTIQPAAGEGFKDNANVQTNALCYNQANGIGIASNSNYNGPLLLAQDWVRVVGLQFRGNTASNSIALQSNGAATVNSIVDSCIMDNGAASNAAQAAVLDGNNTSGGGITLRNCVFIVNSSATAIGSAYGVNAYNCTVVRVGATSPTGTAFGHNYGTARVIKNCAVFGFTTLEGGGGPSTATTNATDLASPPAGWTGSLTYASQFVDTGSTAANRDFRLKAGAGLLNAATTDTTNIPTAADIVGTSRPQGSAWDIGAWELVVAAATFVPYSPTAMAGAALTAWAAVSPMPPARQLLPPSTINVPVNAPPFGGNDFNQPQVYTALGSWTPGPDAPRQTLRPLLPASLIAVPVNAPPVRGATDKQQLLAHPSWLPADPQPATQRFFVTVSGVAATIRPPFGRPWLSSTLGSWQSPLDAPRQTPKTQILSVDQPSPNDARDKQKRHTHLTWLPVDQPPAPRPLLPASITAVPVNNPPGILPVWQSGVLSGWLPGPDAPRQPPPTQIVSVDRPPPAASYGQAVLASWQPIVAAPWQSRPAQISSVDQPPPATAPRNNAAWTWQATDAPRQLPAFAPIPGAAAVASYVWPITSWTSAVLASWTLPPDPPRQLVNLAPALTAVPVNNPPGIGAALAAIARPVWDVDPFALRFAVRFPQAAVAAPAFQPGSAWLWQSTALSSWMPAVLPPQQVRPSYLLSVDQPPALPPRNHAVLWTWQTPDGPPTQFRPVQISSVDPPPATPPRNHAVLASWQPIIAPPWQARPSYLLSVDQPPARHQRNNAGLWTWQALDRPPAQSRPMAPYGTAITSDPPPPRSVAWVTSVLASWQPVGVMPQRWQPVFPPAVVPSGPTAPLAPAASRTVLAPGAVRYTASPGVARYTAAPAGPRTTNA